jgi:hypothetical protein
MGEGVDAGTFDPLIAIFEGVMTDIATLFEGVAENLPDALASIDWSSIETSMENLKDVFGDLMEAIFGEGIDLSSVEGLRTAIQTIVDAFAGLTNVTAGILEAWTPFISALVSGLKAAADTNSDTQVFAGNVLGMAQALNKVADLGGGVAGVLGGIASVLSTLVNLKLASMVTDLGGLGTSLGVLKNIGAIALPVTISIIGGQLLAEVVYTLIPGLKELDQKAFKVTMDLAGSLYDFLIGDAVAAVGEAGEAAGGWLADGINKVFGKGDIVDWSKIEEGLSEAWGDGPELTPIEPEIDWSNLHDTLEDWGDDLTLPPVTIDADPTQATDTLGDWGDHLTVAPIEMGFLYKWTDASGKQHITDTPPDPGQAIGEVEEISAPIAAEVDEGSVERAKRKIAQTFKEASVHPVGVDVKIDGTGVGPAFETGLVDYFKQNPMDMDNIFDPGSLSDLFDAMSKATDPSTIAAIRRAIDQAISLQEKLGQAQTSYINAQTALMQQQWDLFYQTKMSSEQGGTIKVEASGLEPEMEAFMFKLLKLIQIRANESGAEFLLAAAS